MPLRASSRAKLQSTLRGASRAAAADLMRMSTCQTHALAKGKMPNLKLKLKVKINAHGEKNWNPTKTMRLIIFSQQSVPMRGHFQTQLKHGWLYRTEPRKNAVEEERKTRRKRAVCAQKRDLPWLHAPQSGPKTPAMLPCKKVSVPLIRKKNLRDKRTGRRVGNKERKRQTGSPMGHPHNIRR